MNAVCPCCQTSFEPEPGFYQGAMFISYALSVGYIIAVCIVLYLIGGASDWAYMGWCGAAILLLFPVTFRYSRIFYLHLFGGIKFDVSHQ